MKKTPMFSCVALREDDVKFENIDDDEEFALAADAYDLLVNDKTSRGHGVLNMGDHTT